MEDKQHHLTNEQMLSTDPHLLFDLKVRYLSLKELSINKLAELYTNIMLLKILLATLGACHLILVIQFYWLLLRK